MQEEEEVSRQQQKKEQRGVVGLVVEQAPHVQGMLLPDITFHSNRFL